VCRAEIEACAESLTRVTGRSMDLFAYPYGAVDARTAALVRSTRRWGLSCDERVLRDSFDAGRVPRLEVKRWDVQTLASRIDALLDLSPPAMPHALTRVP
jgi:peptidoglycan/xylan/chitin deacetylase (PgdA/CDA1 family)